MIADTPGTSEYIAKIKAAMQASCGDDQPGEDSNGDGMYCGKSLALGAGGRSKLLLDKITLNLVEDGMSYDDARGVAKSRVWANGVSKYGQDQMTKWAKGTI